MVCLIQKSQMLLTSWLHSCTPRSTRIEVVSTILKDLMKQQQFSQPCFSCRIAKSYQLQLSIGGKSIIWGKPFVNTSLMWSRISVTAAANAAVP